MVLTVSDMRNEWMSSTRKTMMNVVLKSGGGTACRMFPTSMVVPENGSPPIPSSRMLLRCCAMTNEV